MVLQKRSAVPLDLRVSQPPPVTAFATDVDVSEDIPSETEYDAGEYVDAPTITAESTPTYMTFAGLINLLDKIEAKGGPPARIDRAFFGNASGSAIATTMAGLRFFGMIDEDKRPTSILENLVPKETRSERMRALIEGLYPEEVRLAANSGTQSQLDQIFARRGLRALTTLRKAVSFFLQSAEYSGIPLSNYFDKSRPANGTSPKKKAKPVKRNAGAAAPVPGAPPTPTQRPSGLNLDEKRSAYIDLLLKLAEKDDNQDALERLERALGYDTPAVSSGI